jgi:hypothetical protein
MLLKKAEAHTSSPLLRKLASDALPPLIEKAACAPPRETSAQTRNACA